jgi:hypothetical protein
MSSLIDVKDFFKGEKLPYGHPYQTPKQDNLATKPNKALDKESQKTRTYKKKEKK